MGFNRCHNRDLFFGPEALGGIGAYDLRIEAGLSGIETIIRNIRTPGNARLIILLFLCTWQHVSGLTKPLLEYPKIKAPFLEGMHYRYIRSFLAEHNLSLEIEPIKEVLPPRENDQSIMDLVSESNFKDCEMKRIYYCKCYLQVWWVSDLCNAAGTKVK